MWQLEGFRCLLLVICLYLSFGSSNGAKRKWNKKGPKVPRPEGPYEAIEGSKDLFFKYEIMQELPGGKVVMGSLKPDSKFGEYNTKVIYAKPFLIDKYPVSVAMFRRFLKVKLKYVPRANKQGYSYVFRHLASRAYKKRKEILDEKHPHLIRLDMASWRLPEGPGASKPVDDRLLEPVVHVSYYDAVAYCNWKRKRLPTELEWEFAARARFTSSPYPWGNTYVTNRSNLWDGEFPDSNLKTDGYVGLAPIDAYPAQNTFDMYDILGNVWEWTSSVFRRPGDLDAERKNLMFIAKGGSFLDSVDGSFNHPARISARKPFNPNMTLHNVGFRCALSPEVAEALGVYRIPQHSEL